MPISRVIVASAVDAAFREIGDLKISVAYTAVVVGTYDAAADSVVEGSTTKTIQVVNVRMTDAEMDYFPAGMITQKLLIRGKDLAADPTESDKVVINGATWQVRKIKGVPGKSLWTVYLQLT